MKKVIPKNAVLIPNNAKKVFKGELFDVYQWPQDMFDGSTSTFEMLKRPDTVLVIGVVDNKIIMIDDEQPNRGTKRQLPGGRVDETDSSWLEAAKREMQEETGYIFKNWKQLVAVQPQSKIEWFVAIFITTDVLSKQNQQVDAGGEKINIVPINYDEFSNIVITSGNPEYNSLFNICKNSHNLEEFIQTPEFTGS